MPTFRQDEKLGTKVPLIKTADLNDKSVTAEKLAEGSVTNSKLAPESVTQDKFDKELLQIFKAAAGLPENLIETIQNIDSTLVDHQRQISSNDDDISDLQTKTKQIKDTVDGIAVSGGASVGSAVTYDNTQSGLDAQNIQNAIDELVNNLGHYETNEEWLRVYTDAENKFLWGIRIDGSIDWAVGIPRPIQKKIEELIATDTAIQESITQLRGELTESLNNKVQSLKDNEIKNLQDTKVDKEEGKSLIEDEVKECFRVIENEEFLKAIVDSEDKVLFGFYRATGKPYYPQNDMYHISQNEEFLWVILDAVNHPLLGIKRDGTSWAAKAQWLDDIKAIKKALSSIDETLKIFQPKEKGKGLINIDVADSFFYISNDEYLIAVVDAEDRILAGIKYDGEPYFPNHEMYSVITNEEWLYAIIDAENKVLGGFRSDDGHMIVGGIDISTFISDAIIDISDIRERTAHLSTIVNDEYLSVETDAEGKVIGYIAPDGSHYLYKVKSETIPTEFSHIEDPEGRSEITTDAEGKLLGYRDSEGTRHEHKISASHINLADEAAKEVNEAFKSAGIKMENPSDFSKDSHIELPIPRIAAQVRLYAPKLPTTKHDDIEAEIEYNDKDGNYFLKPVILNSQGSSSMGYIDPKTGAKGNIAIDINDGSGIKFGDFPTQDSFHLKKYYIDIFRGQCIVGYHLIEQVYKSHPIGQQYPYEYSYSNESDSTGLGDVKKDFFTGAKCHPDGFPIIITWVNTKSKEETWMGIYAWNLKKSKEVFFCDKKKSSNILLDGNLNGRTLWGGNVDWTMFEIRNPKSLIDINGNKYDGDNPVEPSNTDSFSKSVKESITRLSSAMSELKANQNKETFEKYFLVNPFIDYYLTSQILYNYDGFDKNWLWETLNSKQWFPNLYDVDSIFGQSVNGAYFEKNSIEGILGTADDLPSSMLVKLYESEIKNRYWEFKNKSIFTTDNIVRLLNDWLNRIGYDNISKEIKAYPETPSYRKSFLNSNWELVEYTFLHGYDNYDNTKEYAVREECTYLDYKFKALNSTTGNPPLDSSYKNKPVAMGMFNSVLRVKNWLDKRIAFLDNYYKI